MNNTSIKKKKILVIGLGYVGITLLCALLLKLKKNFYEIYGYDKSNKVVNDLKKNKAITYEKNLNYILRTKKNYKFYNKIPEKTLFDIIIICVGTYINKNKKLNKKNLFQASKECLKIANKDSLIIVRSTVKVGTTKDLINKIFKNKFHIAYCPERTVEGNAINEIVHLPQLIGTKDNYSKKIANNFFKYLTKKTINFNSYEEPELIKLLDNTYRDTIFSFSNKVALICEKLKINSKSIIKKANYNFERNDIKYPGPVGGPCLSKDPYILSESVEPYLASAITTSRKINNIYIKTFIKKIFKDNKNKNKLNISIIGIGFKGIPDTNDIRDSTAIKIIKELIYSFPKVKIYIYDKFITNIKIKELGCIPIRNIYNCFKNKDACIIHGNNKYIKNININYYIRLLKPNAYVYDIWNNFGEKLIDSNVKKYKGVGI